MEKNMHVSTVILIAAISIVITGCSFNPSKTSQKSANKLVSMLTYAQDQRTNLCYAMIEGSESGNPDNTSLSITWVPCEPKVLEQIK